MDECVRRARESGAEALTLHTTDMMRAAMQLYERLGFRRMPELDFEPAPAVTVRGFRLDLSRVPPPSHRTLARRFSTHQKARKRCTNLASPGGVHRDAWSTCLA